MRVCVGCVHVCVFARARVRAYVFVCAHTGVAMFDFTDLCGQPLGAHDYLSLSKHYHTFMIHKIPKYVRVHMCARMYTRVYLNVRMCSRACARMFAPCAPCAHMPVCGRARACVCALARARVCMCACTRAYVTVRARIFVCTCPHVCLYARACVPARACVLLTYILVLVDFQ